MKLKSIFVFFVIAGGIASGDVLNRDLSSITTMNIVSGDISDNEWRVVDSLSALGLTKSAIDVLDTLLHRWKKDNNQTLIVKALLDRIRLESKREEGSFAEAIAVFEKEIREAREPLRSILHSVIANIYWNYYRENLWRFSGRSKIVSVDPADVTTWDYSAILAATVSHYAASLSSRNELCKVPLAAYSGLVQNIENAGDCRGIREPTLYDFLGNRAIDFFITERSDLPQPSYAFTIDAADYFDRYDEFVSLHIPARDSLSFAFRALAIMQKLIAFHKNDSVLEALINIDLKRLSFVRERAAIETKDNLYLSALDALVKRCGTNPAAAEVMHTITQMYAEQGKNYKPGTGERYKWRNKTAYAVCDSAIRLFPGSYGACLCARLKNELTAKRLSIETEKVSLPGKPFLALLSWKNCPTVWLRVIPVAGNEDLSMPPFERIYGKLSKIKPMAEWCIALPDDGDLQPHTTEVKIQELPPGHYALLASATPGFRYSEIELAFGHCRISRIAYFGRRTGGSYELYVRDRQSGRPLAGATVTKFDRVYDETEHADTHAIKETYTADTEGRVTLPPSFSPDTRDYLSFAIRFAFNNDTLITDDHFYINRNPDEYGPYFQTFFFTDRSIYRPGQTIYFKGIVLKRTGDKSVIMPRRKTVVVFKTAKYQTIASRTLITNEYGAISGNFTAPSGACTGRMEICDSGRAGFASVFVEEYKRPAFDVIMQPVSGSYRLNKSVTVAGQAQAYTGAAVNNGRVTYKITRFTHFLYRPDWRHLWYPVSSPMEIIHGSTTTNDTGGFNITFTAVPDAGVAKEYLPTFCYSLTIDVTDMNGETRSASVDVTAGYTALKLIIDIPPWIEKEKDTAFAIKAMNQNGIPVPTRGTAQIFRLKSPAVPMRARLWEKPDKAVIDSNDLASAFPGSAYDDEDKIECRPREEMVYKQIFDTKTDSLLAPGDITNWREGLYEAEISARDIYGSEVKTTRYFVLYSALAKKPPAMLCDWFVPIKKAGEPGENAVFLIGTAEKDVRILFEIEHKNASTKKEWFTLSNEQKLIEIPIQEKHRGNFAVHFAFIKNNRIYNHDETITVPWTNKELTFAFETFRDKLTPGNKEEWRIRINGKNKNKVAAEMIAAMYDASLDAFDKHKWRFDINPSYCPARWWDTENLFGCYVPQSIERYWNGPPHCPNIEYPRYVYRMYDNYWIEKRPAGLPPPTMNAPGLPPETGMARGSNSRYVTITDAPGSQREKTEAPGRTPVFITPRVNLNETAFFFPHLTTNEKGDVVVSFTAPEALTRWKLLGFAHTADLCYGSVEKELVTRKLLMTVPNLPRFLREGDTITLAAKVTNLSDGDLSGAAQLFLFDATTRKPVDSAFGLRAAVTDVSVKKGQSALVCWELRVPEGVPAVAVRIAAKAGDFSDGEETTLPLLTNRTPVTETMPLPMRTKGTASFTLQKLFSSGSRSSTLRNHKLTLEFTQNPAWYAVQALPYLMEYPYECAEQTFSRYYANTIASGIANSTPTIKAVFDSWRSISPNALLSNLEKNQELKSALLEETPWVLDGKNESENKRRVALLFDLNKMSNELALARGKLQKMQLSNGGWPWFDGMPDDRFITQYIVTGLGRLLHLKMSSFEADGALKEMVEQGLRYCDRRVREDYESVLKFGSPDSNHLGCAQIQYLYARSYFPNVSIDDANKKAFEYYKRQATKYWLRSNRYLQGMIALSLNRMGEKEVPSGIIRSLKENSLASAEMGMYWKEAYEGHWYDSPIEMQALFIEAFDEVARDSASVDAMKVWLLKSKQTQNWNTTKATAEACYALLLRGADWLAQEGGVTVTLGSRLVDPKKLDDVRAEAGTGYFKTSWSGRDIEPSMGNVKVTKTGQGVSWGALYWQYFEQLDKITPAATPLKLSKKLFIKRNTDRGPALDALAPGASCAVGDKITVRIELRADRDLEYVHLKDMRASGFEPLNVLSGYRWRDGLGYYESTRDAASHFFIAYLQKGTYVFEYDLVAAHEGRFSNGISSVQCMYAPEFSSHSEGSRVRVGK